ncbi:hypothetical protein ZWY2020_058420 [Hordeum vulgare]|nr:hypothetical protein ZWY2020_058420 [Hordeum vulgare]
MVCPLQAAHETDSPDRRLGARTDLSNPGFPHLLEDSPRPPGGVYTQPPDLLSSISPSPRKKALLPRHQPHQLRRLPEAKLQKLLWHRQRPPHRGCSSRSRSQNQQ